MAEYVVRIKATIIKAMYIEAESEAEAVETAHSVFTVENDNEEESYEETLLNVDLLEN